MKLSRLVLIFVFFVFSLASVVNAEYDPPGPPAVEVRVWLISFTPLDDFDDGWNGKSDIRFDAVGNAKDGKGYYTYFEYDQDTVKGKVVPKDKRGKDTAYLIYKVRECWPVDLEVEITATDIDSPPVDPNDFLGSAKFKVDKTLKKKFYNVVIPGKFVVRVYVEAVPVKDDADKCSFFFDQPETKSSSIVTKNGTYIYDFEFANMLKMWIGDKGFANMLIVFQQCFGGGMADDIMAKIDGDIAIISASKHDEPAWGYAGDKVAPLTKEVSDGLKKDQSAKEIAKTAEKNDKFGVYGLKRYDEIQKKNVEHPQYVSKGEGDKIVLGKKSDGGNVKSKHAIIFGGSIPTAGEGWEDIKEMYNTLKGKGFTDEDIVVLADSGKSTSRPYVDGPGTKQALWNAIKDMSGKMNEDEQLVIYITDHGNLETTEKALDILVNDTTKMPIPSKNGDEWSLDENFLWTLNLTDDNLPYISLMVGFPVEMMYDEEKSISYLSNIVLYLNGLELSPEEIEPVYALDEDTDIDAYEVIFPIYNEDNLKKKNLIEIGFDEPELFRPFNLEMLLISTGSIPRIHFNESDYVLGELNFTSVQTPDNSAVIVDVTNSTYVFSDILELNETQIYSLFLEQDLFSQIVEKKNWYNKHTDMVPDFIKSWFGNSRVNVEILMNDGSTLTLYMVIENSYINELEKGELIDASGKARLNEGTARKILSSDDPVKEVQNAIKDGEIDYSGIGLVESIKVELVKVVVRVYFFIADVLG